MLRRGMMAAAAGGGGGSYYAAVMADAPLGYWRLSETSGTTAADSGSAGVSGTYTGTFTLGNASLVGDAADKSVSLSSGHVSMGTPASFKLASGFTYEAVITVPAGAGERSILSYGNGGFCLRLEGDKRLGGLKSQIAHRGYSSGALAVGSTYHVAARVTAGGVLTFWVNGSAAGSGTTAADYDSPADPLCIGADFYSGTPYSRGIGAIDECAIYATALSDARILAHAQAAGF